MKGSSSNPSTNHVLHCASPPYAMGMVPAFRLALVSSGKRPAMRNVKSQRFASVTSVEIQLELFPKLQRK